MSQVADANTSSSAVVADTNELQTDWADGGRLDLILDTAAATGGGRYGWSKLFDEDYNWYAALVAYEREERDYSFLQSY